MASVVTYRNDATHCFCQLKFESGERVLISIAGQPHSSIKLVRLALGGFVPRETLWELDSQRLGGLPAMTKKVIAMFSSAENPLAHPLDEIRDALLPCRSVREALELLREREAQAWLGE